MSTRLGGRYQIVRELGAGGMGRVFQAVDTETGRAVAAKVMLASSDDNLDALLRFQQEGAVLSTLKHPNIVEVYGTFLEEHTSCIIMELLEGQSLGQLMRSERLTLPRIKSIAAQTSSALAYAHGRAIVHRDIKPDNIMVVGDDHVKVTDFGIARILRQGATLNTATGMSIGTPLYMAPEQIEGQKVDGRADIYSLGAVMYQMVAGRPPFEGDDPLTVAFAHVHKAPAPPRSVGADVPEDWEALILKCLAKDPGERFQSAAALHDAIMALGGTGPVTEPAPSQTTAATASLGGLDTIDRIINPEVTSASKTTMTPQPEGALTAQSEPPPTIIEERPQPATTQVAPQPAPPPVASAVAPAPQRTATPVAAETSGNRVPLYAIGGVVLLLLLIAGGVGAKALTGGKSPTPTPVPQAMAMSFNSSMISLQGSGRETTHFKAGEAITGIVRWTVRHASGNLKTAVGVLLTDGGKSFAGPTQHLRSTEGANVATFNLHAPNRGGKGTVRVALAVGSHRSSAIVPVTFAAKPKPKPKPTPRPVPTRKPVHHTHVTAPTSQPIVQPTAVYQQPVPTAIYQAPVTQPTAVVPSQPVQPVTQPTTASNPCNPTCG